MCGSSNAHTQNGLIAVAFELETVQPGHGVSHWLTSLPDIAPAFVLTL